MKTLQPLQTSIFNSDSNTKHAKLCSCGAKGEKTFRVFCCTLYICEGEDGDMSAGEDL